MPTPSPCYLPGCVLTADGSSINFEFGGFGSPEGAFSGLGEGSGGFPKAFPSSFAPPQRTPRGTEPPVFTPKTRPQPTSLPVPPAKPPAPPPPPTPLGEPPIDEPPYSTYNEDVFKQYQQSFIDRLLTKLFPEGIDYMLLSKILSGAGDVFNLATYTADLGPTLAEETARVSATLANQPPGGLPYADPLRGLADQIAASGVDALPNITGYPDPVGSPTDVLPEQTVSASRIRPASNPLAEPYLAPVSPAVYQPGLTIPRPAVSTLVGTLPATVVATAGRPAGSVSPSTRPRVGLPGAVARPELLPTLGLTPGAAAGPSYAQSPLEGTQPGVAPNQTDCQTTKTKQQNKKRKKRNVCYRGTYEERANGLLKWRKERIQCR